MLQRGLRHDQLLGPLQGCRRKRAAAHAGEDDGHQRRWYPSLQRGSEDLVLHPPLLKTVAFLPRPLLLLLPLVFLCLGGKPRLYRVLMPRWGRRKLAQCLALRGRRWRHRLAHRQARRWLRGSGSGGWLNWRQSRRRGQTTERRRHELIRQAAAPGSGERRLLARIQIYQGRGRARGARRGWQIMDGPVAVLHWLVDGKHPRLSGPAG